MGCSVGALRNRVLGVPFQNYGITDPPNPSLIIKAPIVAVSGSGFGALGA